MPTERKDAKEEHGKSQHSGKSSKPSLMARFRRKSEEHQQEKKVLVCDHWTVVERNVRVS